MKKIIFISFVILSTQIWGHGKNNHSSDQKKLIKPSVDKKNINKYKIINNQYLKDVKGIFRKACFDCHGNETSYPWYYKIPGIKQLINSDITRAKKHLDFSDDFPFVSHDTPKNDLNAIKEVLRKGSMPPWRYKILHSKSVLTKTEVKKIEEWIKKSQEILNE